MVEFEEPGFRLTVSYEPRGELWAPYQSENGFAIVCGRIALDEDDWLAAETVEGAGGLAAKSVWRSYRESGLDGLSEQSGAFALLVYDRERSRLHLTFDAAGCFPCFAPVDGEGFGCVLGSHADVVARQLGIEDDWDSISLAQFVSTGVVSHPYTYYRRLRAHEQGATIVLEFTDGVLRTQSVGRSGSHEFNIDPEVDEDQLALDLAEALRTGTRKCTSPRLGRTLLALSGGLDSRSLISAADRHSELATVCAFDSENDEFRAASAIARALGVEMIPLQRSFDHYGDHAELGVRISGGMGNVASNHFLGFRSRLRELGCENLVTGCYFDYLFKSLAINTRESRFLRREELVPFSYRSYLPVFSVAHELAGLLEERLTMLFPVAWREDDSPEHRLNIAAQRTLPLWREGDNIQRLISARTFGWYAPATFREVLDVYWSTPLRARLGKSMFRKTVLKVIAPELRSIPDCNTGVPVYAMPLRVTLNRYKIAMRRRLERKTESMATAESWPNWAYYLRRSDKIQELWSRPAPRARELIAELTGTPFVEDAQVYVEQSEDYFERLLTLKLWAEQRG